MHICLFIIYDCLRAIRTELSSCNRDHVACKAKNIPNLYLYRGILQTPTLEFYA